VSAGKAPPKLSKNPAVSKVANGGVSMRYVPWHVKAVRPELRKVARNAARRCGLSVSAWLNSLIIDAAAACYRPTFLGQATPPQPSRIEDAAFAAIRKEIGELKQQMSRLQVEPAGFEQRLQRQLDHAISALQGLVSQVASPDLVAALSHDIKALGDKIDRNNQPIVDSELLLAQLKDLRAQNGSWLAALRQQIATSAADAIRGPAESICREVASLKEIQTSVERRTQDTFEATYDTIEHMVDRLAAIEDELRDRHVASHAGRPADKQEWRREPTAAVTRSAPAIVAEAPALVPSAAPVLDRATTAAAAEPQGENGWGATALSSVLPSRPSAATTMLRDRAVPGFAPDACLVPGSGTGRTRMVANAIDRIATSEAANGIAKSAEASASVRAKFVAAARRAAHAVRTEHKGTPTDRFERPRQGAGQNFTFGTVFGRFTRFGRLRAKFVVLGVGAVLFLSALGLTFDLFHNSEEQEPVRTVTQSENTAQPGGELARSEQPARPPQGANLQPSPVPFDANPRPGEATLGPVPGWGVPPDTVRPTAISARAGAPAASPDMDAFLPMRNALLHGLAVRDPASPTSSAAPNLTETPLPTTIGGKALLAAASAGDPDASYEIGLRFAQGRNVAQDFAMAAAWLERAARSGLTPAQFRLGSIYEKGLGVKKDLVEAHRLYVAAAEKGHAKAMHNLAVLYAGGLNGKPDYATASQWFRRAAEHGIVDSQYNLAILYARGVGIGHNLAESYKWFALAAKGGDKDAARKRDEVAMRLDPKQLESAKLNVESFVAVPPPVEATAVKVPAGGWDQAVAAATTKSKAFVRPGRFPDKQDAAR
jgi:localization factor PodJL